MTIDDCAVTALVDTGADYSVISSALAKELKKVLTQWNGPRIRTAGGHLITPTGRCTARVGIRGFTYVGDFVVLAECSRDMILGMDFLQMNGAVIDLRKSTVTFSTQQAISRTYIGEPDVSALRIADNDVMVPPRSSVMVLVSSNLADDCEGLVEGNTELLLERGICVARGLSAYEMGVLMYCSRILGTKFNTLQKGRPLPPFMSLFSLPTCVP